MGDVNLTGGPSTGQLYDPNLVSQTGPAAATGAPSAASFGRTLDTLTAGLGRTGTASAAFIASSPALPHPQSRPSHNTGAQAAVATAPPDPKAEYSTKHGEAVEKVLDMLLGTGTPPLTDEDVAQLRFAYYHPTLADPSTTEKLATLHVPQNVTKEAEKLGPPPAGWEEVKSDQFDQAISDVYKQQFEKELGASGLSQDDMNKLRMVHYHPDAPITLSPGLQKAKADIEKTALNNIRQAAGIPAKLQPSATWNPTSENSVKAFDNTVNVNFQFLNEQNMSLFLQGAQPPLTADQQKELTKAISQYPDATGIDPKIAVQAKNIIDQSTAQLQAKYGVPATWVPPEGPKLWVGSPMILGAAKEIDNTLQEIDKLLPQIPDGPGKSSMVSALKMVKAALQDLQNILYSSEGDKATAQKSLSFALCEGTMDRIKERQEQVDKQIAEQKAAAEKQEKSDKIGKIMKIVTPIMIVVAVLVAAVSFGTLGPLAVAVIIALTALSAVKTYGGPDVLEMAGKGIGQGLAICINELGSATGFHVDPDSAAFTMIGKVVMISILVAGIVATGGGGAAGALPGALAVLGQSFATSGVGTDVVKVSVEGEAKRRGVSEDEVLGEGKIALYGAIIGAGVAIICAIGSVAAAAKSSAGVTKELTEKVADATDKMNRIQIALKQAQIAAESGGKGFTEAEKVVLEVQYGLLYIQRAANMATLSWINGTGAGGLGKTLVGISTAGAKSAEVYGNYVTYQLDNILADLAHLKALIDSGDEDANDKAQAIRALIKQLQKIVEAIVEELKGVSSSIDKDIKTQKVEWAQPISG